MIDAGISMKRIRVCLAELGLLPTDISAVLITHEHSDHVGGLKTMAKQYSLPIFAPRTVANHLIWSIPGVQEHISVLDPGETMELRGLSVTAFQTPHDTPQSAGYRIDHDGCSFGYCTDLGHVSQEVASALCGIHAVVLESNHDVSMLRAGNYPLYLKRRIMSDNGHLSNEACGDFAAQLAESGLEILILAHLSDENNSPHVAERTVREILDSRGQDVPHLHVAPKAEMLTVSIDRSARCSA